MKVVSCLFWLYHSLSQPVSKSQRRKFRLKTEEGDISTKEDGIPFGNESISKLSLDLELLKQGFNFTTQTLKTATRESVLSHL